MAISQPALGSIDELLIATVAGCAGESSSAHLTAAVQGRSIGVLLAYFSHGDDHGPIFQVHKHQGHFMTLCFTINIIPRWRGRQKKRCVMCDMSESVYKTNN